MIHPAQTVQKTTSRQYHPAPEGAATSEGTPE